MRRLALSLLALALAAGCETTPEPVTPTPPVHTVAPPAPTTSVAAAPADPAPVTEGDITVAWVNGLQILVKRLPGSEISAAQLYIRGGVRNWTAANAGIEGLSLSTAAAGGTSTLDKDAFSRRLADLGSDIDSGSGNDYSWISAKCLTKEWDTTFALLADTFLHPALPASELEVQRQRSLAGLRHERETPDSQLGLLVHERMFAGHPYAHRATGTLDSVTGIKLDDVRAHLSKLRETGRLLFVVAGDVDPNHLIEQVRSTFGALPRGDYQETKLPKISFALSSVAIEEKKLLPTNYIESVFPAPGLGDADYPAAAVAMSLLGYRIFQEVRTKRNLSYGPSAFLSSAMAQGMGAIYVTAVDPNAAMKVMLDEVKRLQTEPVTDKDLNGTKSTFLTSFLVQNESTDGQSSMLARAQILGGDFHLAKTLPERVRAVTAAEVQAFAKKYAVNLQATVLGDPAKIDKALFGSL